MKVLVATDAWRPQVNGVVRTYERLAEELPRLGASLDILSPDEYRSLPLPTLEEIRLAVPDRTYTARRIAQSAPDAIHLATEGPVGLMVRAYCRKHLRPFTTSYHTRFPEYLASRFGIPAGWIYAYQRRFHNASAGTMVATPSLADTLASRGFTRLLPWTRGVDGELFHPRPVRRFGQSPVFLYAGRIALEKNLEAFLALDLPGRKVVVGDGPLRGPLAARFPDVLFTGTQFGEDLALSYASADVFVFPSRTDTFGIVLLEAIASGVPVAAYPVTGPRDIVNPGISGVLSEDLRAAALSALDLDRRRLAAEAARFTWAGAARLFLDNIAAAHRLRAAPEETRTRGS